LKDLTKIDFESNTKESKSNEVLEDWEIVLREQQKQLDREKQLKLKEQGMRPWVQELFESINDPNKLYNLFVAWSEAKGFKNEKWFDIVSNLIQQGEYKGFINLIKSQYLNCFSDCNKKLRGVKVKKIIYQFEKHPRKLYSEKFKNGKLTIELTEYGENQLRIQNAVESFCNKMNSI